MDVDDPSETSFSICQGMLPWQPIVVRSRCCYSRYCWQLVAQPGRLTLGFAYI